MTWLYNGTAYLKSYLGSQSLAGVLGISRRLSNRINYKFSPRLEH